MNKILIAFASLAAASLACAHVSVQPDFAEAGATYRGVLHVGHGCDGKPTTALEVQLPGGGTRTIAAADKQDVPIEFAAPKQAGPAWIKVVQRCGAAAANWADVPAQGASTEGMKTPAVLVQVLAPAQAAAWRARPAVEGAWVRASVPGQQATGAFMRITATEPTQLVAVTSPVAGVAQVHAMKMDGDVMRMRPAGPIELPVGRAFELTPGGYHVMLQDLRKPVEAGSAVPITLVFRNAKGVESRVELRAPVALQPPPGGTAGMHKH
ncbi:MAG TPA: copper chaperone PCu(A)C [Ramlibacter sp.]|nr:copper chaperone PCu(A)C [Ramlibacter sp.]